MDVDFKKENQSLFVEETPFQDGERGTENKASTNVFPNGQEPNLYWQL